MAEPGNSHDRNAVAAEKDGKVIGHLPRSVAIVTVQLSYKKNPLQLLHDPFLPFLPRVRLFLPYNVKFLRRTIFVDRAIKSFLRKQFSRFEKMVLCFTKRIKFADPNFHGARSIREKR